MIFTPGVTSQSIDILIVDDTGVPVTGLVAGTMPAITYSKGSNVAATAISLSDLAAITSSYSSGGVFERSGGVYRLDLPDAVLSTAANVTLIGSATNKRLIVPAIEVKYVAANLVQILGTALTETAGQIAAGFKKFFNIATPLATMDTPSPTTKALIAADNRYNNTYYVLAAGNDSNTGLSPSAAFLTFSHACAVAVAGDLIIVGPGTFTESAVVTIPCSVRGAGKRVTKISSSATSVSSLDAFTLSSGVISDIQLHSVTTTGYTIVQALNAVVDLQDVVVTGKSTAFLSLAGTTTGRNCEFVAANASGTAVGIYATNGHVERYINCLFSADSGGGAFQANAYYNGGADIVATNCSFFAKGSTVINVAYKSDAAAGRSWLIQCACEAQGTTPHDVWSTDDSSTPVMLSGTSFDPATSTRYEICVTPLGDDAISADSVSAEAVTKIQAGLSTYAGGAVASVTGAVGSVTGDVGGDVVGSVGSVTAGVTLAAGGLDLVLPESGVNARQALSLILSAATGVLAISGGTFTAKAGGTGNSGTTRLTYTADTTGRTSVTYNPPA